MSDWSISDNFIDCTDTGDTLEIPHKSLLLPVVSKSPLSMLLLSKQITDFTSIVGVRGGATLADGFCGGVHTSMLSELHFRRILLVR